METRLYNIFKSKNATELTHPTLESSYKVLLDKILFITIKQSCIFYGPLNFQELLTFKLIQIRQYCEKSCETTFFESLDKSQNTPRFIFLRPPGRKYYNILQLFLKSMKMSK